MAQFKHKRWGDIVTVEDGKVIDMSARFLTDEWEKYEEPREYWYIESDGSIMQNHKPTYINHLLDGLKSIGNYFETEEEAEKAIEKLKAWKRLKDNGLTISQWRHTPDMNLTTGSFINIKGFIPEVVKNMKDLDLLFSGEDYE